MAVITSYSIHYTKLYELPLEKLQNTFGEAPEKLKEAGQLLDAKPCDFGDVASKSAEASKQATTLIQKSLEAVSQGSRIAETNAEKLSQVAEKSLNIKDIVEEIDKASSAQAISIAQITQGIEQISTVVQTNSVITSYSIHYTKLYEGT